MSKARWATGLLTAVLALGGAATAVGAVSTHPTSGRADASALVSVNQRHGAHVVPQAASAAPRTSMKKSYLPVKVDPLLAGCQPGYGDPGSDCIPRHQTTRVTCSWLAANGYLRAPLIRRDARDPLKLDPRRTGRACG